MLDIPFSFICLLAFFLLLLYPIYPLVLHPPIPASYHFYIKPGMVGTFQEQAFLEGEQSYYCSLATLESINYMISDSKRFSACWCVNIIIVKHK